MLHAARPCTACAVLPVYCPQKLEAEVQAIHANEPRAKERLAGLQKVGPLKRLAVLHLSLAYHMYSCLL